MDEEVPRLTEQQAHEAELFERCFVQVPADEDGWEPDYDLWIGGEEMPQGIVDKPQLPNQPRWSWWQRVLGWLRRGLNVGHDAGVLPKKGQGPRF